MQTRHQYLKEMGIDVWLLRDGFAAGGDEAGSGNDPAKTKSPAAPQSVPLPAVSHPGFTGASSARTAATHPAAPGQVPPRFNLCFCHYERLSLCFSLPEAAEGLDAGLRRFSDDIALALGISAAPRISALSWPMVDAPHLDQSEQAAGAVIRQRMQQAGDIHLLFGATVERWVGSYCQGQQVLLEDIATYLAKPQEKRSLWQAIRGLRAMPAVS